MISSVGLFRISGFWLITMLRKPLQPFIYLTCKLYPRLFTGAFTYLNSFGGEVVPPEIVGDVSRWGEIDVPGLVSRNSKDIRQPEIFECARALRARYKRVADVGFCYGGWAICRLGAKGNNLVDCVSTAHPSLLEKSEMEKIGVPIQIMAPEFDTAITVEL